MTIDFYHVCSSGTYESLMFRSDTDFVRGVNDILVCSLKYDIEIYAYCLMNNHFHFLLRGEYLDVKRFAKAYLQRRLAAIKKVYSEIKHSEDIDLSIKHIADTDYLRGVCGYILRNPMAAGMNVIPTAYPWSSASMYFNDNHCLPSGRKLSSLSIRMQRELFSSKVLLPQDLVLDDNNLVHPGQYVKVHEMEQYFNNPRQFSFYLSKNNDVEYETDSGILKSVKFRDDELYQSLEGISINRFSSSYKSLSIERRCIAAADLVKKYRLTTSRAARISSLPPDLLSGILGRYPRKQ